MSDLLARLIQSGTPADLVAEVATELARAQIALEAIEQRRATDRERSRRRRCNVTSRDITGHHVVSRDVQDEPALSRPPNENNSNPPTHTHPDCESPRARKADPFPRPDWADPVVWADLLRNRKAKRLPNTVTAHTKFIRDLTALVDDEWPPGRLLEAIVARGWGGAYDPRENRNDRDVQSSQHNPDAWRGPAGNRQVDHRDGFTRALDERIFGAGG